MKKIICLLTACILLWASFSAAAAAENGQQIVLEDFTVSLPQDCQAVTGKKEDALVLSVNYASEEIPFGTTQVIWGTGEDNAFDLLKPEKAQNMLATFDMILLSLSEGQMKTNLGITDVHVIAAEICSVDGAPAGRYRVSYRADYYAMGMDMVHDMYCEFLFIPVTQTGFYTVMHIAMTETALNQLCENCNGTLQWNQPVQSEGSFGASDLRETMYQQAIAKIEEGSSREGLELLEALCMFESYRDSEQYIQHCREQLGTAADDSMYQQAMALYESGDYQQAEAMFRLCSMFAGSENAKQMRMDCLKEIGIDVSGFSTFR